MTQGKSEFPPQKQQPPGKEGAMEPQPKEQASLYKASGKLQGKVAIITGGDSGIGHAVAVAFAREGADVAIVFNESQEDAQRVKQEVEQEGRRCLTIQGDIGDESFCQQAVQQHPQPGIEQISEEQLTRTFRTNIFGMFYMTKAACKQLDSGSAIVNTTSVTAFQGAPQLLDYSSTKGAIMAFTRSLSMSLVEKGIRVNAVAPGPIWTPLVASTMPTQQIQNFGKQVPMKRPGQPEELAPAYVFLASGDSSYISGQVIHVNGGEPIS
jgi:NAD(P)-dependent dehydrogenase (short-subunit alcohol dehydrogenase family)